MSMEPSKPLRPRTLTVKRTYEPTRIAAACLADAYARVVPRPHWPRRTGAVNDAQPGTRQPPAPEEEVQ